MKRLALLGLVGLGLGVLAGCASPTAPPPAPPPAAYIAPAPPPAPVVKSHKVEHHARKVTHKKVVHHRAHAAQPTTAVQTDKPVQPAKPTH
jgi:hypothetical protein